MEIKAALLKSGLTRKRFRSSKVTISNHYFSCECPICVSQARGNLIPSAQPEKKLLDQARSEGHSRSFVWLIRHLAKSSKLVEVQIPDLVIFRRGKPWFIAKQSDKPLRLVQDRLGLTDILKSFTHIARKRKTGKDVALMRYISKGKNNNHVESVVETGFIRQLNDREFFDLMYQRPGNPVWKRIVYIQTTVKSKHTDTFQYFAPEISHSNHSESQAYQACRRIAANLYENTGFSILTMNIEFAIDDHDQIWVTYISDIFAKDVGKPPQKDYLFHSRLSRKALNAMHKSLDAHVEELGPNYKRYSQILTREYQSIKEDLGIDSTINNGSLAYSDFEVHKTSFSRDQPARPKSSVLRREIASRNSSRTWQRVNQFRTVN